MANSQGFAIFGGFIGGLLGFVGIFRVREGKPFPNRLF